MTSSLRPARALALTLALAIAGCSHVSGGPRLGPGPQATSGTEIEAILLLLDGGDAGTARKRIAAALARDPMNPSLQVLRDSIERDPKELLGPDSYPYLTKPGDTMSDLAQKFLGNRLKAYQLARYNGIAKPAALTAGQTLRIPGEPPRIEAPRRPEPRPAPAPSAPTSARTRSTPTPTAKPTPPQPKTPAANPAAAGKARAAGLAALNSGNVVRAVGLLRRAAALDPANPAIARDRARAERIAATVRAHK